MSLLFLVKNLSTQYTMGKKTVSHEVGGRMKDIFSGSRRSEGRNEVRGGRREEHGRENGGRHHDGFQDADSSDWLFGTAFLLLLVFALSPGILLTIPPGRGGLFMSGNTSTIAAFVHAVLFVTILNFL